MTENEPPSHPGWTRLPHEHVPRPTYYPAGLALGTAFTFLGLITSVVVLAVGLGIFAAALAGWVREIRHERKRS
jgi:hypothetical protein